MHETIIPKKASFLRNGKDWNLKVVTLAETMDLVSLILLYIFGIHIKM